MMNNFDKIKLDSNVKNIMLLKRLYDNGEISEEELSGEEINGIIKLYEKEIKTIEEDTNRRKVKIKKMLLELRKN